MKRALKIVSLVQTFVSNVEQDAIQDVIRCHVMGASVVGGSVIQIQKSNVKQRFNLELCGAGDNKVI